MLLGLMPSDIHDAKYFHEEDGRMFISELDKRIIS